MGRKAAWELVKMDDKQEWDALEMQMDRSKKTQPAWLII